MSVLRVKRGAELRVVLTRRQRALQRRFDLLIVRLQRFVAPAAVAQLLARFLLALLRVEDLSDALALGVEELHDVRNARHVFALVERGGLRRRREIRGEIGRCGGRFVVGPARQVALRLQIGDEGEDASRVAGRDCRSERERDDVLIVEVVSQESIAVDCRSGVDVEWEGNQREDAESGGASDESKQNSSSNTC